jgi:hypothetical protein
MSAPHKDDDLVLVYVPSDMPRRYCTAKEPMAAADKDSFQWGHNDAVAMAPLFNLVIYRCPHCHHTFHAPPR